MKTNKIILALYVSIIALSTVGLSFSIAWYANSTKLQVNAFYLSIDTTDELKISTSEDYLSSTDHLTQNQLNPTTLFTPVTTAYKNTWMDIKQEKPNFYDDTLGNEDLDYKKMDTGFYNQDLYLFCENDVYVTIDPERTFINANSLFNNAYASELKARAQVEEALEWMKDFSVEKIKEMLDELVKAMRFSVLVPNQEAYQFAIVDPHKDEDVYLGGLLDNDIDRYYDYMTVNNELREYVQGDVNDRSLIFYDEAPISDTGYEYPDREPNAFNARHKAGVKRFNKEASIANGLVIKEEGSLGLDEFDNEHRPFAPLQIPVYKNQPNKINVSIYIEGWDLDSVNYTMGATFDACLQFQIARRMI